MTNEMAETNADFPSDRESFRQEYGYDFPYNSDEDPASIDLQYGNSGRTMGGSFTGSFASSGAGSRQPSIHGEKPMVSGSFQSSGTGSIMLGITQEPLRVPLSDENLAAHRMSIAQRRMSELTNSYQSAGPLSECDNGEDDDIMDTFLKTMDASNRTGSEDSQVLTMRRESIRSKPWASSDKSVAEKSMAESTFFFGNISTSDEGTTRFSRERINIPSVSKNDFLSGQIEALHIPTFPIEDSDMNIDLKMMSDDKSVRSALTCDRSYAMEEALRKLQENAPDEKDETASVISSSQVDESEKNDDAPLISCASSPGSARKSTCSSHYGSFMAWPDSDDEGESSEEEEKSEGKGNETAVKGTSDDGAIVCDFVPDRAAFLSSRNASFCSSRGSFRSNASSRNSHATSTSKKSERSSSSNSSKERRRSRRQKRRASMRGSLETIKSEQSCSFRSSTRRSLTESIDRKSMRESFRRSLEPKRKSLTQQHDATSSALPLMGWDDSNSESSSLLSSSDRKLSSSARKSFSSSLSNTEQGGLFCEKWVSRASFRRGHDVSGLTNVEANMPIEEEFDSRKPWMKAPPVASTIPSDRRGSTMTLDSSVNSWTESSQLGPLPEVVKDDKANGLASSKVMRSSFTDQTATSSLGDDQSMNSDLTELRQAQEALLAVQEDNDVEFDKQQHVDEAMKLLATFPTIPKAARDVPSPTLQLESVDEEEDESTHLLTPTAHSDRLETVDEEEQDDDEAAVLDQPTPANRHITDKPSFINGANMQFLDNLDADISQRFSRSPKEDDSDTYSDVDVGAEKSAPSLGLYMSVHNHELEKEFNTTEMEEIDFKECHKPDEYNESEDLEQFIESGRKKRSTKEDHSSHKSGKSSSKRSGLASMKVISDRLKPIKDRVKKKSGSNHVRRRHKRLWKFCVWNCKKITLLIVLVLCVLAGIAVSSWYGRKNMNAETLEEVALDDQMTDDLSVDIQWPPVTDTGRNPLHDNPPTIVPSTEVTSQAQIGNAAEGTHQSANSSSPVTHLIQPSTIQPSVLSNNNMTSSYQTSESPSSSTLSSPTPSIQPFINSSPPSISLNFSSLSPTYAVTPSISLNLKQTYSPTQSPTFSPSLNQTDTPTQSPTLSPTFQITTQSPSLSPTNNSATPTISPTEEDSLIFQSSQVIAGDAEFQYTGFSVSMTPSGKYIAVGIKEASETGMVRVYAKKKKGGFSPVGVDSIFGESPGDEMGSAVAISDDGKRVAVGARSSSVSGKTKNGLVKVYQYSESLDSWLQVGKTIEGSEDLERLGFAVAISGDGLRVACGSPKGSGGLGSASIYDFNNRKGWELVGQVITGQKKKDMTGFSVSLSSDGRLVAVGAISASLNGMERCGSVKMYNLDSTAKKWVNSGQVLTGITANAQFGYSIKLSGDGQRVVIGSNGYSTNGLSNVGSCEIFQLNSKTFRWKQIGAVFGDDENEEAGSHVSMSANGLWIACSKTTMASGSPQGAVVVLTEQAGDWEVIETITPYFEDSTSFGTSTHLSQDAEDILIGAPLFNNASGYVELLSRDKQV
jgi:hypothetical protein